MIALVLLCIAVASANPLSRIVGGNDANWGDYREQVSLRGNGAHRCGGSILNDEWVLCAAHCTLDPNVVYTVAVFAGDNNEEEIGVAQIINHESYNEGFLGIHNDISLLRLERKATLGFEPKGLDENADIESVSCTITGWGLTEGDGTTIPITLQETSGNTLTTAQCKSQWGGIFVDRVITDKHICFNNPSSGACNGDSGGPMFCHYADGTTTICGITSFGSAGCGVNSPSVYTRVSAYRGWITNHMN